MTNAQAFKALHEGPEILILPNAWNAGSAGLFASRGAKAIATTSSGVAWSHGYADGNHLPIDLHATTIKSIVRTVDIPVSADAEGGYSDDPAAVREIIARLLDAGAVGINLEDGAVTPDLMCAKIEAARQAGLDTGVDLYINARTDVYLRALAPGREVEETLERAQRYAAAGGDGLFVPGLIDAAALKIIAAETSMPVNAMASPGLPGAAELQEMGVRRLSAGGAIVEAAWGHAQRLADAFLAGNSDNLFDGALAYPDLNALYQ